MKNDQKKLLLMNRNGSIMKCSDDDGELFTTIVDSMIITRKESDNLWLFWKAAGYDQGQQYAHTIKITNLTIDDSVNDKDSGKQWVSLIFSDDKGRRYTLEMILPSLFPQEYKHWVKWTKYRNEHQKGFRATDERLLKEHQEIADTWL